MKSSTFTGTMAVTLFTTLAGHRSWRAVSGALTLGIVLALATIAARAQDPPSYTLPHTFTGADGANPTAAVVRDWEGIRLRKKQGELFQDGSAVRHFAVETMKKCGAVAVEYPGEAG